jgi:large subunit ribosomal protein L23
MDALNIIRRPVITEKTALLEEKKIYAFWINPKATKIDIKMAVKELYGEDVAKVRLVKVSEKTRQLRKGSYNKRKESLKAYVTLKGKNKLDLNKFSKADSKESKVKLPVLSAKAKPAAAKKEKTEKKVTKSKKTA